MTARGEETEQELVELAQCLERQSGGHFIRDDSCIDEVHGGQHQIRLQRLAQCH